MKKAVFIVLGLFCLMEGAFSQNKINNHSFENRSSGTFNSRPNEVSGINKGWCSDWSDAAIATADWFKAESSHIRIQEDIGGGVFQDISGSDGTGYAGIISGEMIQTKTNFPSDRIQRQRVKLKIRISDKDMQFNDGNGVFGIGAFEPNEVTNLNVYISENKMDQVFGGVWCNPVSGTTVEHEVERIQVATIPISLTLHPSGQWHEIEAEFSVPSVDYQWIGFDHIDPITANQCFYIFVDEVVLEDAYDNCSDCIISCDPVDGCIEPTFLSVGTTHSENVPFSVGNLTNVSNFKLTIRPQNNINQLLRTILIENPYTIVSWDGKEENGAEASAINYNYTLDLSNSCETRRMEGVFPKFNVDATDYKPIVMDYLSVVKQDISNDECCYECIEISNDVLDFIDPPTNLSQVGGENTLIGTFNIVAINKIVIDDNVNFTTGSNITFQAKDTVDFIAVNGQELAIEQGAEIEVIIDECMEMFQEPPPPLFSRISIQKAEVKVFSFAVKPNPSSSTFEFQLPLSDNPVHLQIINLSGQIIHETTIGENSQFYNIDLSEESKGIYFVKLKDGKNIFSGKVILK